MKDWLVKRLTPQKATEERWISLSRVLQELWEFFFDPALSRLERLRSYYQADEADLDRKLREMGDYFQADFSRFEDKPIAVSWRNLELKYKDLELILTSTFRRHYKNLPVEWYPLFAPVDRPYGSLSPTAQTSCTTERKKHSPRRNVPDLTWNAWSGSDCPVGTGNVTGTVSCPCNSPSQED